jgi:DNA gyrase inhibitor GyrI
VARVEVNRRQACKVAYIQHSGDYDTIPFDVYLSELHAWVRKVKVTPGALPLAICYDSPQVTPPGRRRVEIGITFEGHAKPEGRIRIRELPGMEVAVIRHRGPSTEYPATYRKLTQWIASNGFEWDGPAIEIYTRQPRVVARKTIIYAAVQAPVRKKLGTSAN